MAIEGASTAGFVSRAPRLGFVGGFDGVRGIGILMVLVTEVWPAQVLVRPFLGVGILGGFTTFSTYVVDIQRLADQGASAIALAYLLGTVVAALVAVYTGIAVTERLVKARS